MGGGLWASVTLTASSVLLAAIYLFVKQRHFLATFFRHTVSETISWKTEMLPMQWRMAGSCICGYFVFSILNPFAFYFFGAEVAGRVGLTVSLLYAVGSVTVTWLQAKTPMFGIMLAQERYGALRKMTIKLSWIFAAICGPLLGAFAIAIWAGYHFEIPYHERFLRPLPTLIFAVVVFFDSMLEITAVYVRAHKEDPYLLASFVQMILVISLVATLGYFLGAIGLAIAYLAAHLLVVPWNMSIFFRYWRRHL
jgi:membrane protein CcdC involved in cytochrome C biogenesis